MDQEKDNHQTQDDEASLDLNTRDNELLDQEIPQEEEAVQVDETTEKAKKFGYKTKEQWEAEGKDPAKYKSPEQFVKYGEEYDLMNKIKSELSEVKTQNKELLEQYKRNAEEAVRKARIELENQLQIARQNKDVNAVEQLSIARAQYDNTQRQSLAEKAAREQADVNSKFMERNAHWFNDSRPDLQAEARQLGEQVFKDFPTIGFAEAANKVEERMKWNHPEIATPKPKAPMHIPSSQSNINKSAVGSQDTASLKSLTPEQQVEYKTVKALVETNPKIKYTVQDYIQAMTNSAPRL